MNPFKINLKHTKYLFVKKPSVNCFSKLRVNKFQPTFWFKLFPGLLFCKIPQEVYDKCYKEMLRLDPEDPPLGEELVGFAYEKYTGRDLFEDTGKGAFRMAIILAVVILTIVFYTCPNC